MASDIDLKLTLHEGAPTTLRVTVHSLEQLAGLLEALRQGRPLFVDGASVRAAAGADPAGIPLEDLAC